MKKLLTLLAALFCVATGWAQANANITVYTEEDLRAAIEDGSKDIILFQSIALSGTLEIPTGKTININLSSKTLNRSLDERDYDHGGQVITVRKDATLNLSQGILTGGWGGDSGGILNEGGTVNLTNITIMGCKGDNRGGGIVNRYGSTLTMTGGSIKDNTSYDIKVHDSDTSGGGGIFNAEGATATLKNVSITGNEAKVTGGGGICNWGSLTLDGCTITGNTCEKNGGGIYNFSTATLNMKGKMTITDNIGKEGLKHNVFLKENAVITVTGALTDSKIGITLEDETGTFTSGYKANNSGVDPATIFTPDLSEIMAVSPDDNNEAQLTNALPDGDIYYIERSWDDASKSVKAEIKILKSGDYTTLTGGDDITIQPGYYVVKDDVKYNKIQCTEGGNHSLILCDGAKITADFVQVEDDNELDIYAQTSNTGQLVVNGAALSFHAGIGSDEDKTAGTIIIHGGNINTNGSSGAAGIGGGYDSNGGTITIYGGIIHAEGGDNNHSYSGAGIGGGSHGNSGTITIYGGNIYAKSSWAGAGIGYGGNEEGGGHSGPVLSVSPVSGGAITIYGGTIEAHGSTQGAGIGGGYDAGGGTITINGGIVKAWGGEEAAGIGSGLNHDMFNLTSKITVNGGEVYAYGGDDGAGIGGGYDANGADVTINSGYVYAKGNGNGAGIGGGEDADGGTVTISGGYVYAKGSYGGAGIGGGEGGDGANVTITGGTVHASAGSGDTGNRAIGPGYGDDVYGSLTIGDLMMVRAERMASAVERHDMCWYRTDVHVEMCTHQDHTYTWSGTTAEDTHTEVCGYCTTPFVAEEHIFVNGVCTVCGVEEVQGSKFKVQCSDSGVTYNLSGQKVSDDYKGIVIKNGKKYVK